MKRSITRKVSDWKPGESTEPLPLNVSDQLIEGVLDMVQDALEEQGIDVVVLGAEINLHAVQRIGRKAPAKPVGSPKKHTCGIDGDPGAAAPLNGQCQACIDAIPYEGDTMNFTGKA